MAQKTRKVCYIVFDENTNCWELYLNEQKYDDDYEEWDDFVDEIDDNLSLSFPLVAREGDKTKSKHYIHLTMLGEISRLIQDYNYTFLGQLRK